MEERQAVLNLREAVRPDALDERLARGQQARTVCPAMSELVQFGEGVLVPLGNLTAIHWISMTYTQ